MRKKVLLIEDREIVITGIKDSLRRKSGGNIEVESATNFYSAKELLSQNHYDIISLDLNMARIDNDPYFDELPGTTLNGWLFLKNYILADHAQFNRICSKVKIIIFSGFINELREEIRKLPQEDKQRTWLNKIELVNKIIGEYDTITNKILTV